jgi:hypothetical protein
MAGSGTCPDCGAHNDQGVRRCRVCAALLDSSVAEDAGGQAELPEHVQRWMSRDLAREEPPAVAPRQAPPPPPALDEAERFDPDALFREIDRPAPPPPPAAPPPPAPTRPETPWAVDVPDGASGEEIEQATARAMREERLRRRPGFLDRIFTDSRDEDP